MTTELILGGQRSGKSRRAEERAKDWLAASPAREAVLIATATAWDGEMTQRIARHQADRLLRVPTMRTVEESQHLGAAISRESQPGVMVVVDCLTLWLTAVLMPVALAEDAQPMTDTELDRVWIAPLISAIASARGPVVLVGNEIGMGVIPMGSQTRAFVDSLGRLNQAVAQACDRVTMMVAGLPMTLKGRR